MHEGSQLPRSLAFTEALVNNVERVLHQADALVIAVNLSDL